MDTYKCDKCGVELIPEENWAQSKMKVQHCVCKTCECNRVHEYYLKNREDRLIYAKKYRETNIDKVKNNEINYRRSIGVQPMSENKKCPKFLGCHVAERVLKHVFKDVEAMPENNVGYDFICNKGKKIDVKAACEWHRCNKSICWVFHIRQNIIADYFLCLAFDDRDNLNPLHMWLLPAEKFNHLTGASISHSTINKWDEYRLEIDKAVRCCDTMKKYYRENKRDD